MQKVDSAYLKSKLDNCFSARTNTDFNLLVLSSGGDRTAFSAAILGKWMTNNTQARFDVICASSGGAIVSTYGYLIGRTNTSATPEKLKNFFLKSKPRDWYRKRSLPELLLNPRSLYSTQPLRAHLQSLITREIYSEVVEEVKTDNTRRLFVATLNADQGMLQIWDLTQIVEDYKEEGYDTYIDVLIAASAVELYFPPVYSDGHHFSRRPQYGAGFSMFMDGGMLDPVFLYSVTGTVLQRQEEKKTNGRTNHITAVLNGYCGSHTNCVSPNMFSTTSRSLELMLSEIVSEHLRQIEERASKAGAEFTFTSLPKASATNDNSLHFDQTVMRRYYTNGLAAEWTNRVPERQFIVFPSK